LSENEKLSRIACESHVKDNWPLDGNEKG
jgi:hypothetical protein